MSPTIDFGQRQHARALTAIGVGILLFQLLRDQLHVRQRGLNRDAILEPRYAEEIVAASPLFALRRKRGARPELRGSAERNETPAAARR